jgi:hypothetical protein
LGEVVIRNPFAGRRCHVIGPIGELLDLPVADVLVRAPAHGDVNKPKLFDGRPPLGVALLQTMQQDSRIVDESTKFSLLLEDLGFSFDQVSDLVADDGTEEGSGVDKVSQIRESASHA